MAKRVQRRRGTTSDHSTFTGRPGELTVDTTVNTVVVHDGTTLAGHPLSRADGSNLTLNLENSIGIVELDVSDGDAGQVLSTDGNENLIFTNLPDVSGSSIGGDLSGTIGNAQLVANSVTVTELAVNEGINGQVLSTNGTGTLSFINVSSDPTLGGDLSGTASNAQISANKINIAELNVSDGTSGQVLATNGSGDLYFTTNSSAGSGSSVFVENNFVGNSNTIFTLSVDAPMEESLLVFIDGVSQPTTAYTLSGTGNRTITFSSAPATGSAIKVLHLGIASTLLDGSVTSPKLAAGGTMPAWNGEALTNLPYDIGFVAGFDSDMVKEDVAAATYGEMIMGRTGTFVGEAGYSDTATSGSTVVDIEKNGSTIYSSKPQFSSSSNMSAGTLSTTSFVSGDRITFKVTTIGSTPGQGIRFTLKCKV